MPDSIYILAVPLLPLAVFLLTGIFGRRFAGQSAGWLGTFAVGLSAILSLWIAFGYFTSWGAPSGRYESLLPAKWTWLPFTKDLQIDMGLLLDPISVMMIVVVTLVSFMVHLFSLWYMKGEERFTTYYAFLALFTFSMLGLVLSSNLFQTYVFWELVGVSSFLLIGFHYDRPSAVAAAKKAFIVTRFADLGFLIGILILSQEAQTLDFKTLIERLTSEGAAAAATQGFLGFSAIGWGLSLVFMGAAGKSAMFPLHIWLPDAMEGPTPVSALIHAATMVVAGVFLVARLFPVYALRGPDVLEWISWIGAGTALFAAVIACTQTDIKRVLAYSTLSQIGFMMFALGVSGYGVEQGLGFTASQFHLFTHALFKALLFLGAGAVIHAVHSNELADMGGLRKRMPFTHATFLIACLAIAGIPPLSGFFSKEEILMAAYDRNRWVFGIALLTSGLTAFYMFRLYYGIFWNRPDRHTHGHGHSEGGFAMWFPLLVLAVGAVVAGFIPFGKYVTSDGKPLETHLDLAFSIAPVAVGLAGITLATLLYRKASDLPDRFAASAGPLYRMAYNKFHIDEIYLFVTKRILFDGIGRTAAWFDRKVVDRMIDMTGFATTSLSERIKAMQSGKVQQYAFGFLTCLLLLAVWVVYWTKRA
jgi:NADH-quinone oxidoreductase subunit L